MAVVSWAMNATLSLDLPAEAIASAHMTLEDIRLELAILLLLGNCF
jgi:hypothetical protein